MKGNHNKKNLYNNIGGNMKKAINLITILIVLLTFCVSAFATGNVHDNTTPQPKTGTGVFSCRTIAPMTIDVIPASGVSNPGLVFVKPATGVLTYNLTSSGFDPTEMITTFRMLGEPNQFFYRTISVSIATGTGLSEQTVDGVKLKMIWKSRRGGVGSFEIYDPSVSTQLGGAISGTSPPKGEYEIRAYYTDVVLTPSSGTGIKTFYQTVTVSYNAGDL